MSLEDKKITKINKIILTKEQKHQRYLEKMKILNPQKINLINVWKKYPKKLFWMLVSAFLYNIAITVFLKKAATIASGTSSLSQIITFTAPSTAQFYGLFYVLVNLPLMFIYWRLNPRTFMVITYYWMFFQLIVQCIFIEYQGRASNPIVNFINQRINLYDPIGQTFTNNGLTYKFYWDPYGFDTRVLNYINNGNFEKIFKYALSISTKTDFVGKPLQGDDLAIAKYLANLFKTNDLKMVFDNAKLIFKEANSLSLADIPKLLTGIGLDGGQNTKIYGIYNGQNWPILIYAILGGIMEGLASIVAWKQRGSIGGTSVISNYIAYKNKKPVGTVFLMVAICFSSCSTIVIGSLEYTRNIIGHTWDFSEFLVRIMGTAIYLLVFSMLVNKFYPKYKKVKIDIYTTKPELVAERFKQIGYVHSFNVFNGFGGYNHQDFGKIETIALYLEKESILEEVRSVDKKAWISISNIHGLIGSFDTSYVD